MKYSILILCVLVVKICDAQINTKWIPPYYTVTESPNYDKNSSSYIIKINSDKKNRVWFITYNKLYKYDGTKYTSYSFEADSLGRNYFFDLLVDNNNIIWVSTMKGIGYLNEETNKIEKITHLNKRRIGTIKNLSSMGNKIFFGNEVIGLCNIEINNYKIEQIAKFPDIGIKGLIIDSIRKLIYYKSDIKGLCCYNLKTKQFEVMCKLEVEGSYKNFGFENFFIDKSNITWVLSNRSGVNNLENLCQRHKNNTAAGGALTAKSKRISKALQLTNFYDDNIFLVNANNGGLLLYNNSKNVYSEPLRLLNFKDSIDFIGSMHYQTNLGIIWFSINKKLYSINLNNQPFLNYIINDKNFSATCVDVIENPSNKNETWLLSSTIGLKKYNNKTFLPINDKEQLWVNKFNDDLNSKCQEGLFYGNDILYISTKYGLI